MLKDLEEALLEQKMQGVEKDTLEVISRALQVDPAIVTRVIYAYQMSRASSHYSSRLLDYLPEKIPEAISRAVSNGLRRVGIRDAIAGSKTISLVLRDLIPEDTPQKVCEGCHESLTCIAENQRKPKDCLNRSTVVFPLRFIDPTHIEVECTHPAGKYIVPLKAFPPTKRGDL